MKRKKTKFLIGGLFMLITVSASSQTWMQENSGTLSDMNNINFANNNTGWAFGDSVIGLTFQRGIILKTINQGATWSNQSMGSDSIQILSSYTFSPSSVIAVGKFQTTGNGAVIKTIDDGLTWVRDTTSVPERLFDVDFTSINDGWIVGRNGYLGNSIDGGINWTTQSTTTGEDLFSISMVDVNNGWAVGADPGSGGTILHTTDGGSTWTVQTTTTNGDLLSVKAFNDSVAIAVGQGGIIISTSDSGNTWNTQTSSTVQDLNDISFVDINNGWAVGSAGTIIKTTDGGTIWSPETSNTINDINSIDMKTTSVGWNTGKNGDIYFYGSFLPNGVFELESASFNVTVYPNPSSEKIIVELHDKSIHSFILTLLDLTGKVIITEKIVNSNQATISVSNLTAGSYLFNIVTNDSRINSGTLIIK